MEYLFLRQRKANLFFFEVFLSDETDRSLNEVPYSKISVNRRILHLYSLSHIADLGRRQK